MDFARLSFFRERDGSVALMSGLVLPMLLGASLFVADTITVTTELQQLQRVADASALSVAKEMRFVGADRGEDDDDDEPGNRDGLLSAIALNRAQAMLKSKDDLEAKAKMLDEDIVRIHLAYEIETPLASFTGLGKRKIEAVAAAQIMGGQNICIISLETGRNNPGIELRDSAQIRGEDCGIYSNSEQAHSIRADGSSLIDANFICSAGGYEGPAGNFTTSVTTDCAQIEDPLAARAAPGGASVCDYNDVVVQGTETTNLNPGTYCGGLTVQNEADVWLNEGEYIFTGGPLIVQNNARFRGEHVGLYFNDADSYFQFKDDAEVSISAPINGPLAGIVVAARKLCWTNRCTSPRLFEITSSAVRSLLGTIYIPQDDLTIDTTMPVSEEAAFTIIVIDNLLLKQAPSLVLNTDYAATDVPVPKGFAGQPSSRLVE